MKLLNNILSKARFGTVCGKRYSIDCYSRYTADFLKEDLPYHPLYDLLGPLVFQNGIKKEKSINLSIKVS